MGTCYGTRLGWEDRAQGPGALVGEQRICRSSAQFQEQTANTKAPARRTPRGRTALHASSAPEPERSSTLLAGWSIGAGEPRVAGQAQAGSCSLYS